MTNFGPLFSCVKNGKVVYKTGFSAVFKDLNDKDLAQFSMRIQFLLRAKNMPLTEGDRLCLQTQMMELYDILEARMLAAGYKGKLTYEEVQMIASGQTIEQVIAHRNNPTLLREVDLDQPVAARVAGDGIVVGSFAKQDISETDAPIEGDDSAGISDQPASTEETHSEGRRGRLNSLLEKRQNQKDVSEFDIFSQASLLKAPNSLHQNAQYLLSDEEYAYNHAPNRDIA